MGCCVAKKTHLVSDATYIAQDRASMSSIRECIVEQIHKLQFISIKCKSDIHTCILSQDKDLALLIISKQMCIKDKSKELQELIESLDNFNAEPPASDHRKIALLEKGRLLLRKINKNVLFDDCSLIPLKNSHYLGEVKKALKVFQLDESQIESQFDLYSRTNDLGQTIPGSFKRHKFVKALHKRVI